MPYIDYFDFYLSNGGTVEESAFSRLEFMARRRVDHYTFGRVTKMETVPEEVKRLMVELINMFGSSDVATLLSNPQLTGFSNDGYSESYGAAATVADLAKGVQSLIFDYLSGVTDDNGVPLLYAGVD